MVSMTRMSHLQGLVITIAISLYVVAMCSAVEFNSTDKTFHSGDKSVSIDKNGIGIATDGRDWSSGFHYFKTDFQSFITQKNLKKTKQEVQSENKRIIIRGRIPLTKDGRTAGFRQDVVMLPDDTVQVKTEIQFDDESDRQHVKAGAILFQFKVADVGGESVRIGDEVIRLEAWHPKGKAQNTRLYDGKGTRFEFFPDNPNRNFVFNTTQGTNQLIDYRFASQGSYVEFRVTPERVTPLKDASEFTIALPESPETSSSGEVYAGIDFFKRDGFHVPDYSLCHNLIQNPGFEAGFHYWSPLSVGKTEVGFDDFAVIDEQESYRGKRSLRMTVRKGQTPPMVAHFAVPVEPGRKYTFSFYAKADRPDVKTSVLSITQYWPNFPLSQRIELTQEWERYSFEVTAPNRLLHIGVGERWWDDAEDQVNGAHIWVDCVQLEEGGLTEYTEKPLLAEIVTGKFAHTYEESDPKRLEVIVHNVGDTERDVHVILTIKDFFDRERYSKEFTPLIAGGQSATQSLSLDDFLSTGYYVISAQLSCAGFKDTDYFRVCVIRPLDNLHKNKNLFSTVDGMPYWQEKQTDFQKRIGIGSIINGSFNPFDRQRQEINDRNRIRTLASIFDKGGVKGKLNEKQTYTPEGIQQLEEEAYQKAKKFPYQRYWKLINEPGSRVPDRIDGVDMEDVVRAMAAVYRGIKRANPDAQVVSPDPSNMYKRGRDWLERYIEAGGLKTFDILGIHPYRTSPEDPDMDADAQELLEMLDRHEFHDTVWWTEGIYYAPYTISELGITTYRGVSSDFYRCGALSYDSGRSEKLAAAWVARSFLIGLKYHKRVDMNVDWGKKYYSIDFDQTPNPYIFAYNTLGNLLGNATYQRDIDLCEGIRAYVFTNEKDQPIAAVWNFHPKVNRFEADAPVVEFAFKGDEVTAVDFMMNQIVVESDTTLKLHISPYPVFLIGRAGALPEFVQKLTP